MAEEKFDHMYKILIVGNSGAGKTCFLTQYVDHTFNPAYISTVGIDFRVKSIVPSDEKNIKLQIWDTSGQERYEAITTAYYPGAHGFILMFDVTNEENFVACRQWVGKIKDLAVVERDIPIVLVGNKLDLDDERVVTTEAIEELSQSLGLHFFKTSAKNNTNIEETFEYLVNMISERMKE